MIGHPRQRRAPLAPSPTGGSTMTRILRQSVVASVLKETTAQKAPRLRRLAPVASTALMSSSRLPALLSAVRASTALAVPPWPRQATGSGTKIHPTLAGTPPVISAVLATTARPTSPVSSHVLPVSSCLTSRQRMSMSASLAPLASTAIPAASQT